MPSTNSVVFFAFSNGAVRAMDPVGSWAVYGETRKLHDYQMQLLRKPGLKLPQIIRPLLMCSRSCHSTIHMRIINSANRHMCLSPKHSQQASNPLTQAMPLHRDKGQGTTANDKGEGTRDRDQGPGRRAQRPGAMARVGAGAVQFNRALTSRTRGSVCVLTVHGLLPWAWPLVPGPGPCP